MRRLLTQLSLVIRRSLMLKLMVAFLIVSLIGTGIVAVFAGLTTATILDQVFLEQARANFIADATSHYEQTGSWEGVSDSIRRKSEKGSPENRNSRDQASH